MISGLYSAATALDAAEARHRVASENLAHVHQPGHRRRILEQTTFAETLRRLNRTPESSSTLGTRAAESSTYVDFTSGILEQSGRSLDLAIQGDGFFAVDGPEGPLYTRNGRFFVSSEGVLTTIDGLPVRGTGGPLTIPQGTTVSSITVDRDGRLVAGEAEIGQLELVRFESPENLQAAGASLFSDPGTATAQPADVQVLQGFIEGSNVTPINELISIMISSRQYEAGTRVLKAIDRSIEQRIGLNR